MAQSVEHILGKDEVTSSSLVSSSIKSHEKIVGFLFPPNQTFTSYVTANANKSSAKHLRLASVVDIVICRG